MEVPKVFDLPGATFTLMQVGIKFPPCIPVSGWQLPENGHTYKEALEHNGNVGFRAGSRLGEDLVTIGLDEDNLAVFQDISLPPTTTWETRPGRLGMLFTCSGGFADLRQEYNKKPDLAQFKFYKDGKGVGELKLERTYQVIPNSWKYLDPEDGGYRVDYKMTDTRPPAYVDAYALMHTIMELPGVSLTVKPKTAKATSKATPRPAPVDHVPVEAVFSPVADDNARSNSYALAALLTELGLTESAAPGSRFEQVYKSGCALGEFVGGGLLPEVQTFNSLVEAGCKAGLETGECIKSAKNGIAKGKTNPRKMPRPTTAPTEART